MKQARTRILSLLLALVMCLSLLPITAMAEETDTDTEVSYTITFDANGGKFPDGNTTMDIQTKWLGAGNNITTTPPDPTREGYTFDGWEIDFVWNYDFQANTTVKATWSKAPELVITFDPNGGICDVKTLPLVDWTLMGTLPTPTRAGYTFLGWFRSGFDKPIQSGEVFSAPETVTAKWSKNGATEQDPVRIDFFANGGRITQFNGKQIPALTPGEPPYSVDANTGIDQNSGILWTSTNEYGNLSSIPVAVRDGYTFDGWYKLEDDSTFWDVVDSNYFSEVFPNLSGQKLTTSTVNQDSATYVAKWVKTADTFTVTFDLNGATGTPPAPQKVEKGKTVTLPVLRASNAEFLGWGYSTDGRTLTEWKAEYPVTSDLTLYAMWETSGEDTYNFSNSSSAFDNYKITDAYFNYLTQDEGISQKAYIRNTWYNFYDPNNGDDWGGSCFGMSAVYCMARGGAINLGVFQNGSSTLRALKTPRQSKNVQDLINFYMMAQSTTACGNAQSKYSKIEKLTDRYRQIVSDLSAEKNFSVLCFTYGSRSGHAIVARSVESGSDGNHHIEIWDPNYPEDIGELVISSDYARAQFSGGTSGAGSYNVNTEIKCILPFSTKSQTYDKRNLQSVFGKAGNYTSNSSNSGFCLLSSSVGNFTVTADDGRNAVVENGQQISGNLSLLDAPLYGGLDGDYRFYINTSDLGEATITMDGGKASVKLVTDSIFADVSADALNRVTIGEDQISTDCPNASQQEITMVSAALGNTWNMVTVSGKDAGITLSAQSGQLKVSSQSNTSLTLQGENVDTQKTSGKQTVTASSNGTTITMSNLGTGAQQPSGDNPFTDVKAGVYYYDAVMWAVQNGVTSGTSATTFSPDASCTRGQIVTFLWRAAGSPKPASNSNPFTDVKAGAYYYDAVLWAVEKGITSGTSATTFSPDASCTRGQTVTFLYRAAGSPKTASSANPFTDVKAGAYYYDAVLWAVEKKVTSGTSATTFAPDSTVTRGQTVTFLHRSQGQ